MKSTTMKHFGKSLLGAAAVVALIAGPVQAREPFTPAELAAQKAALLKSVDKGFDLWHGSEPSMTTNGLACGNCHPDAAAANPQTFPKFIPAFNRVVTFREMINWCVLNPQAGKALDVSGPDMTAMEAYAFYLHRGLPIEPGLATRQTTSIAVTDLWGYEGRKPSGVGFDKK
jgi:thiosulfate dehydrogenase